MHQPLQEIPIKKLKIRPFDLWDTDWLLLTSGDFSKGSYNAMTVAWGSIGNMWNLPIAMVVVRPTRYTYGFINTYLTFTLCGFSKKYRKALNILGTKSGRDGDKISEAGLTPTASEKIDAPTYKEANLSIECRKIYFHDFNPGQFLDDRIEKHYALKDYHRMIFGEILMVKGNEDQYLGK